MDHSNIERPTDLEELDLIDALDPFAAVTRMHIPRALIVEDSAELGQIIQEALYRIHILAFHETSGRAALERYDQVFPDVVLLDINLPDMTGWEVLDVIKERRPGRQPAILIISASGDPANRLLGKLQAVDEYLVKPFKPTDIQKAVREILDKRGQNGRP
jgi:two-component system response regulator AdeR